MVPHLDSGLIFIICSYMLQITINIDHVNALYLFSFTYSYVLVKARQLFVRESTSWFLKKWIYYLKYSDGTNKTKLCYHYCCIYLWWDFSPPIFSFKTEVWLLGTEIVELGVIYCSTWIRGYGHYISKYSIYILLELKILLLHQDLGTCCTVCCKSKGMDVFPTPSSLTLQDPWHT